MPELGTALQFLLRGAGCGFPAMGKTLLAPLTNKGANAEREEGRP